MNRLRSGLLQLPKGIQIILDETVLEPGQLKPNGIENLKCLGNLITWQKLAYDFGFSYNIEFECDAKVLILGEVSFLNSFLYGFQQTLSCRWFTPLSRNILVACKLLD